MRNSFELMEIKGFDLETKKIGRALVNLAEELPENFVDEALSFGIDKIGDAKDKADSIDDDPIIKNKPMKAPVKQMKNKGFTGEFLNSLFD